MDQEAYNVYKSAYDEYVQGMLGIEDATISMNAIKELGVALDHNLSAEQLTFMVNHCNRDYYQDHPIDNLYLHEDIPMYMIREMTAQFEAGVTVEQMDQYIDFSNKYVSDEQVKMMGDLIQAGVNEHVLNLMKEFEPESFATEESNVIYSNPCSGYLPGVEDDIDSVDVQALADAFKSCPDWERVDHGFERACMHPYSGKDDMLIDPVKMYMDAFKSGLTDEQIDKFMDLNNSSAVHFTEAIKTNAKLTMSLTNDQLNTVGLIKGIADDLPQNHFDYLMKKFDEGMEPEKITILENAIHECNRYHGRNYNIQKSLDEYMAIYGNKLSDRELNEVMQAVAHDDYPVDTLLHMTDFKSDAFKMANVTGEVPQTMRKMRRMLEAGFTFDDVQKYINKDIDPAIYQACRKGYEPDMIMNVADKYGIDAVKLINDSKKLNASETTIKMAFAADCALYSGTPGLGSYHFADIEQAIMHREPNQSVDSILFAIDRWRDMDHDKITASIDDVMRVQNQYGPTATDRIIQAASNEELTMKVNLSDIWKADGNNLDSKKVIDVINHDYNSQEMKAVFHAINEGVSMEQIHTFYPPSGNIENSGFNLNEMTKAIQDGIPESGLHSMASITYDIYNENRDVPDFDEARVQQERLENKCKMEQELNAEHDGQEQGGSNDDPSGDGDNDPSGHEIASDQVPKGKPSVRGAVTGFDADKANPNKGNPPSQGHNDHDDHDDR